MFILTKRYNMMQKTTCTYQDESVWAEPTMSVTGDDVGTQTVQQSLVKQSTGVTFVVIFNWTSRFLVHDIGFN